MLTSSFAQRAAALALIALGLTACSSGTTTSNPPNPTPTGQARVRLVDGSPDAGQVAFGIDSQTVATATYGGIGPYNPVNAGSHTITVIVNGTPAISVPVTFASGGKYSLVLAGELKPTYTPGTGIPNTPSQGTLNLQVFGDPLYGTAGSAATVTFRHAAPALTISTQPVQVGYVIPPASTTGNALTTLNYGQVTTAISLPQAALNQSIGFYALNPAAGITITPKFVDSANTQNVLPFNADINFTLYIIDGGGATSQPSAGTPTGTAALIGTFDPNG